MRELTPVAVMAPLEALTPEVVPPVAVVVEVLGVPGWPLLSVDLSGGGGRLVGTPKLRLSIAVTGLVLLMKK